MSSCLSCPIFQLDRESIYCRMFSIEFILEKVQFVSNSDIMLILFIEVKYIPHIYSQLSLLS